VQPWRCRRIFCVRGDGSPITVQAGGESNVQEETQSSPAQAALLPGGFSPSQVAPLFAVVSCILYSLNGELLQWIQQNGDPEQGRASPLLNLVLCHLGGLAFIPFLIGSSKEESTARSALPVPLQGSALLFACLLMGYNYAWLMSSKFLFVGLTNAVFQTSTAMVYVSSVILFAEPLSLDRLAGVVMCLGGVALASLSAEPNSMAASQSELLTGVALATAAAGGITVYQVLFKYLYGSLKTDVRFLMEFGLWVSIFHLLVMLPLVLLADIAGVEKLEIPHGMNAAVGVAMSAAIASTVNALYLCIVMWGSPMLLPCASVFSLPLTVSLDVVLHGAKPSGTELLGHALVVLSVPLILNLWTRAEQSESGDQPGRAETQAEPELQKQSESAQ